MSKEYVCKNISGICCLDEDGGFCDCQLMERTK